MPVRRSKPVTHLRAVRNEPVAVPSAEELRCNCGNLLARILSGEIELKCRRCKRVVTLGVRGSAPIDLASLTCSCSE